MIDRRTLTYWPSLVWAAPPGHVCCLTESVMTTAKLSIHPSVSSSSSSGSSGVMVEHTGCWVLAMASPWWTSQLLINFHSVQDGTVTAGTTVQSVCVSDVSVDCWKRKCFMSCRNVSSELTSCQHKAQFSQIHSLRFLNRYVQKCFLTLSRSLFVSVWEWVEKLTRSTTWERES